MNFLLVSRALTLTSSSEYEMRENNNNMKFIIYACTGIFSTLHTRARGRKRQIPKRME